jgi:hypothetical protein
MSTISITFVGSDPICIVSKDAIDLNELSHYPRIIYQTDPSLHSLLDTWWERCYAPPKNADRHAGRRQSDVHPSRWPGLGYALVPYYVISAQARQTLQIRPLYGADGVPIIRRDMACL